MYRIDDPTAAASPPAPTAPGTPGYFTKGNETTGVLATIVTEDWANAVQEELVYVIESAGFTLNKVDNTQLRQSVVLRVGDTMTGPLTVPSLFIGTSLEIADNPPETSISWDNAAGHADSINHTSNERIFYLSHTIVMYLDAAGNLYVPTATATAYKTGGGPWAAISSDDRTKKNAAAYAAGLTEVCALVPIAFQYNGEGGTTDDGRTFYGLSAQATRPIMPELVLERDNGYLTTDLGPLTLALVNAVRTLRDRVEALEAGA